jgi:hypothetical protein
MRVLGRLRGDRTGGAGRGRPSRGLPGPAAVAAGRQGVRRLLLLECAVQL